MKRLTVFAINVLLLVSAGACNGAEVAETRYELHFQAVDDRGRGLQAVTITVGETLLGTTDARGELQVEVNAKEGQRYQLTAPCPPSYSAAPQGTREVHFRQIQGLEGQEQGRMQVRIVCERTSRVAALLVHADGYEGMPILIDGVATARTGNEGFAHLRLDLPAGAQFQVALDSSSQPALVPINPSQTMTIGQEDGLFVFDPVFREAPVEKRRTRPQRSQKTASEPAAKRPVRID